MCAFSTILWYFACSGWLWTHGTVITRSSPDWTSPLLIPFCDVQWGHLVCYTLTSLTSISFKLILPFLLLPPKTPRFLWSARFCVATALSRVYHPSLTGCPGPPRTCAAPRSLQECAGACNRLCGGHWVVGLTGTSQPHSALAAEWGSAWGGSPSHGRCQIPTVAPHNHSHTGPDPLPGSGDRGGGVLASGEKWKSLHLTRTRRALLHFGAVPLLWTDFWVLKLNSDLVSQWTESVPPQPPPVLAF